MAKTTRDILLLGGTGAMGVYLVPELIKLGYEVTVTSRSKQTSRRKHTRYIEGNAKDLSFVKRILEDKQYDAIVDFMVYKTDEFKSRVNFLLSKTQQYMFISSYRVYDGSAEPLSEDSPRLLDTTTDREYLQTDEYALTKARQENILKQSNQANWTIVRPAITYSKDRFQLGIMEAGEFLSRALQGRTVPFPGEMLDKQTTMTWAGDVAQMIARLVGKKDSLSETYTVATSESHRWSEVIEVYQKLVGLKIKTVPLGDYERVIGRKYQIKYDRMFDRRIDNSKILKATGMTQKDLTLLEDGLSMELKTFVDSPQFEVINQAIDRGMDALVAGRVVARPAIKSRIRAHLKKIKRFIRSKQEYDGAILSLGGYYNYGGLIQRYALYMFLKKNGYNFKVFKLAHMQKFGVEAGDRTNLVRFADKYLDEEVFHPLLGGFYPSYIVGSDQVWRDWYGGSWSKFKIFFLGFVKNRKAIKIAYAASFGADDLASAGINTRNRTNIRKYIRRFRHISVREKSAVKLVSQLGGEADVCLDPTLLLTAKDYRSLLGDYDSPVEASGKKTLFTYILDESTLKSSVTQSTKKALHADVVALNPNDGTKLPTMEHWIAQFSESHFVIPDSFHGVVFSIIHNKPFIVFGNKKRGLARIVDLLKPLGLMYRIINESSSKDFEAEKYLQAIDWHEVNKRLSAMRTASAEWLLNAVRDEEQ